MIYIIFISAELEPTDSLSCRRWPFSYTLSTACVSALRREKVAALKRGLESQQIVFRKQFTDCSSALQASYHVAHLLAKESKLFLTGNL
jgi:hypothetical protein